VGARVWKSCGTRTERVFRSSPTRQECVTHVFRLICYPCLRPPGPAVRNVAVGSLPIQYARILVKVGEWQMGDRKVLMFFPISDLPFPIQDALFSILLINAPGSFLGS
jgi:hypothetical protein